MTWRRFAGIVAFLWLGALSGFFYKYRDDLLAVGKTLTTERWQRERLDRELQAFGKTQREQASKLVTLQTTVAANTEICAQGAPDLTERLAASEARIVQSETRLADVEAHTATNTSAHEDLRHRIFRE